MKTVFHFILKYHFFLLFLVFESIAFLLTVRRNENKLGIVISSSNVVVGFINTKISNFTDYLSLKDQNKALLKENAILKHLASKKFSIDSSIRIVDSLNKTAYVYTPAFVINNSVFKNQNYITINKGSIDGITADMSVISPSGAVGIITKVSRHFSVAISILNTKLGLSGKLSNKDYFGSVRWDGADYRYTFINEIPNHVKLHLGDSVVTSGYSALFPPDIPIGNVVAFKTKGDNNFFLIKLKLCVDFKKLRQVYIVKSIFRNEQKELEKANEEAI